MLDKKQTFDEWSTWVVYTDGPGFGPDVEIYRGVVGGRTAEYPAILSEQKRNYPGHVVRMVWSAR